VTIKVGSLYQGSSWAPKAKDRETTFLIVLEIFDNDRISSRKQIRLFDIELSNERIVPLDEFESYLRQIPNYKLLYEP
jgi:hypothetical protein